MPDHKNNSIDTDLPSMRVKEGRILIKVLSDPFVVYRARKYLPVIHVKDTEADLDYLLFVSAISLSETLEEIRAEYGTLIDKEFAIRKKDSAQTSPYEIEELN
tara:strand:+ start:130 stop:438 length:309 start_codon:yes stop_codon:yes gene_type:complete